MFYIITGLLLIIFLGVVYFSRQIIYPKVYTHEETEKYELENETFLRETFHDYHSEHIEIQSRYGYRLKGEIFTQETPEKFVLICHGITSNYTGVKKYCKLFLDAGYSIMLYDHRNHGLSDKNNTSFGYFEKFDAQTCVDYLLDRYQQPLIGVMGESMGAATAMQLAAIDDRLSFCIEDCGFSDAFELFRYRSEHDHHKIVSHLTYLTNYYIKLWYKWNFHDVSVIHNINEIKCPVMFIHGELDDYVPYKMVHELYETFNGSKMIYTVPNAKHAMALRSDPSLYKEKVHVFLNEYVKKRTV